MARLKNRNKPQKATMASTITPKSVRTIWNNVRMAQAGCNYYKPSAEYRKARRIMPVSIAVYGDKEYVFTLPYRKAREADVAELINAYNARETGIALNEIKAAQKDAYITITRALD